MLRSLFDPPDLFARRRLVGVVRLGSAADQHRLSADIDDVRSGEGLPEISFARWLSVSIQILVVHGAIRLPHRLSRSLVERDHILEIRAVEIHDHEVTPKNRGRARTTIMI